MGKADPDVIDLKRRLSRLHRLEQPAIVCREGVYLITPRPARDPRPLVEACREGAPSINVVRAALGLTETPVSIDAALLATAQRDLKVIESAPPLRALALSAPNLFRRYGALDAAWIEHKRRLIGALGDLVKAREAPADPGAWLDRALAIAALIHGRDAERAARDAIALVRHRARAERAHARRLLTEILTWLDRDEPPRSRAAVDATHALAAAAKLTGRRRAKAVSHAIKTLFGVHDTRERTSEHASAPDASLPLEALVQAEGERLIAAMEPPKSPHLDERVKRFFALYTLMFSPRPRGGGPLDVAPSSIERGLALLEQAIKRAAGKALTLDEALVVSELPKDVDPALVADLIAGGLAPERVRALVALGKGKDLSAFKGDAGAAASYADWVSRLAPHYEAMGAPLPISPKTFLAHGGARWDDRILLAACLVQRPKSVNERSSAAVIARFDATLALFERRPGEAAELSRALTEVPLGEGRRQFPAFADFLGDDALLDRFVHLTALAGLPVAISQKLRSEFERSASIDRERAFLASLAERTDAQRERLSRIEAGLVERPGPAWTARRLEERIGELYGQAYEKTLDRLLLRVLDEALGIRAATLSPGLRAAIRFYLTLDKNRDLLSLVLRTSSEGKRVKRDLQKNHAWIRAARARFDVDAWLAERSREVMIDGAKHVIAVEQDPVEVLRMGVPFGTCLSLDDGCNAASTVINAADANKQVVYLRDASGDIIARKLLAVAKTDELVGYHLYVAAKSKLSAIEAIFKAFCDDIAASIKLPLADKGEPEQIHEGFWYDDGTEPFGRETKAVSAEESGLVEAYCRSLGLPVPATESPALSREAAALAALASGDPARLRAAFDDEWRGEGVFGEVAYRLVRGIPVRDARALSDDITLLGIAWVKSFGEQGLEAMLKAAAALGEYMASEVAMATVEEQPMSAEVAELLVAAANASTRNGQPFDDHGLEHQVMYALPPYGAHVPPARMLALVDRFDVVLDWVAAKSSGCEDCVKHARLRLVDATEGGYLFSPDPDAVLQVLTRRRASRTARLAALRIAAYYPLDEGPLNLLPHPAPQPSRKSPKALRAIEALRRKDPSLEAEEDLYHALVRQAGGEAQKGIALPKAPEPAPAETAPLPTKVYTLIERSLRGEAVDQHDLSKAYDALTTGNLPMSFWVGLLRRLAVKASLSAHEERAIQHYLTNRTSYGRPELYPDLVVALARHEGLLPSLAAALGQSDESRIVNRLRSIPRAAERAGDAAIGARVTEAMLRAAIRARAIDHTRERDPGHYRRIVRLTLGERAYAPALTIYKETPTAELRAIFIEELRASEALATEEWRSAVEALREWGGNNADVAAAFGWLTALLPAPAQTSADSD